MINKIKESFADIAPESQLGKIGQKMVRENQEILDRFVAGIRAASENAAYTENTTDEGGVRYSIRQTQNMGYAEQIKLIEKGKLNGSNSLYIGIPNSALQDIGFSDAPFAMNQKDYCKTRRKSGNNKNYSSHSVPFSFFQTLPSKLNDLAMAIDNGDKVTLITDYQMQDTNGNDSFVIAGVWQNQAMESDTVNLIKSAYPLDDFVNQIQKAANSGSLVVINKNKAKDMLATIGVQPSEVSNILNLAKSSLSQSASKSNPSIQKTNPARAICSKMMICPLVSTTIFRMSSSVSTPPTARRSERC